MLKVFTLPILKDNYTYILVSQNKKVAVIDPGEAQPVNEFLKKQSLSLDYIFCTHHHQDHIGGNKQLKERWQAQIFASELDKLKIPADRYLKSNENFDFDTESCQVLSVPGHTLGHIAYFFPKTLDLFCGDCLFSMGCGYIFEETYEQMLSSLNKLKKLNPKTKIYCGHEYTEQNIEFALTVEPHNPDILKKQAQVLQLRRESLPSLPTKLYEELKANPFLRADDPNLQKQLNANSEIEAFTKLRKQKNQF